MSYERMRKWLMKIFCPRSYYKERIKALQTRFLEETKKDKLLSEFANYLLPIHHRFEENCVKDENRFVRIGKKHYNDIYEMGIKYYMGIKILWI